MMAAVKAKPPSQHRPHKHGRARGRAPRACEQAARAWPRSPYGEGASHKRSAATPTPGPSRGAGPAPFLKECFDGVVVVLFRRGRAAAPGAAFLLWTMEDWSSSSISFRSRTAAADHRSGRGPGPLAHSVYAESNKALGRLRRPVLRYGGRPRPSQAHSKNTGRLVCLLSPACFNLPALHAPLEAPFCAHFDRLVLLRTRATTFAAADTPGRAGSLASEHATDAALRAKR